jgi:hypothetical protein
MATTINPARTVIFGPTRQSWMSVYEPRTKKQKDGSTRLQYESTLLLPKKSANSPYYVEGELQKVLDAIRAAIADLFGAAEVDRLMKAPANIFKHCLKDGDKELMDDGNGNYVPRWPGHWYMNATAKPDKPPKLFNAFDGSVSKKSDGWVSGDWARAQVHFYAFNNEGKGVGCGLRALQFCFKDEPFGTGGASVATADDFGAVEGAQAPVRNTASEYDAPGSYERNGPPSDYGYGDPRDDDDPFANG